jgi:formylglycine-generating enzyme required for sulfatase activity
MALLFSSLVVFGAVITTLAGGQSSETYSFSGAETQTGYFSIPQDANVTSASMGLEGQANLDVNFEFDVNSETEFDAGTYFQTDFNSLDANGFVHLLDGNTGGDYNSTIFDANTIADWNALQWSYKDFDCPTGMAFIPKLGGFCIDKYEASRSDATFCDNGNAWTGDCENHYGSSSTPASVADRIPWVNISQTDASTACQAAGKHLCSSEEWMAAANLNGQVYDLDNTTTQNACIVDSTLHCLNHSGMDGEACNTGSNKDTNANSNCVSAEGVYDLIGNVWEWTSDVVDVNADSSDVGWNRPNDNVSPNLCGNTTPSAHYGNDGVATGSTKVGRAVQRGGNWAVGSDAGLFCVRLYSGPGNTGSSFGFRCCLTP